MSNIQKRNNNLPEKIEDLARFVIVNHAKSLAARNALVAAERSNLPAEQMAKIKEAVRETSELQLDAEVRLGEYFQGIDQASHDRGNQHKRQSPPSGHSQTKESVITDLGFSKQQVSRMETLARNKPVVEQVKAEAREEDDIPTRTAVLKAVKEKESQQRFEDFFKHEKFVNIGDEWYTPKWLLKSLGINFDIDVCAPQNKDRRTVPAKEYFTQKDDGLKQDWKGLVWCNPPYSFAEPWAIKMAQHNNGLLLTHIPMNAEWCTVVWQKCGGIRLFQAIEFERPTGILERPALWLQLAAFGEAATKALANMTMPEDLNPRRIPSPMWVKYE